MVKNTYSVEYMGAGKQHLLKGRKDIVLTSAVFKSNDRQVSIYSSKCVLSV